MTYLITFRSRHDAILMREYFSYMKEESCLINAPKEISSICGLILKIEHIAMNRLLFMLGSTNRPYSNIYLEKIECGKKFFVKVM